MVASELALQRLGDGAVGTLTRTALVTALAEQGPTTSVGEAMLPAPPVVAPTDSLEASVQRLQVDEVRVSSRRRGA